MWLCILWPISFLDQTAEANCVLEAGSVLHLKLQSAGNDGRLRPGSIHQWNLLRAVYAKDREVIPAGSRLRIEIGSATHRNTTRKSAARSVFASLKNPGEWRCDPKLSIKSASLTLRDGRTTLIDLSFIRFAPPLTVAVTEAIGWRSR
jgi:hypothetical protein